ncbi:MAG: radical SAM protein [bacterium]
MREKMTFLILPVGLSCNIACKYCYHGCVSKNIKKYERMSDEILEKIMFNAREFETCDIDFLWHGGEPLLAGIDHFKKAIKFQSKAFLNGSIFSGKVRNVIQSNMTLFNKKTCDFLMKNKFIISTSIDGDKDSHDANRIFSDGSGTHKNVLKSISMWRNKGEPIGAVSLITKSNVHKAEQVYAELKACGITSCNFHFCGQDENSSIDTIPTEKETTDFLKKVFDLWMADDEPGFPIRNFRNVLRVLSGGRPMDCTSNINGCYGFMSITSNGDVYPCHRYVERKDYCIGNILEMSLLEIYNNAKDMYKNLCSVNKKCTTCEWLNTCGNGCAYERLIINGSFDSIDPDCFMKKELFEHIKEKTIDHF